MTFDYLHNFRIYPIDGKPWYCRVIIFATRREMERYCRAKLKKSRTRLPNEKIGGACLKYANGPEYATVCLCKTWLTINFIAHEFSHATFAFAERQGKSALDVFDVDGEEWFATVHGRLIHDFYVRAEKLKVFAKE